MKMLKLGALVLLFAIARTNADEAQDILQATGIKGGFVVHLGCGDGKVTAALHANDGFLVQGLDTSVAKIKEARQRITETGLYGSVTIREFDGQNLPFIENMVNLLVVDNSFSVPREEMLRVLCPLGTLHIKADGKWQTEIKPRPVELDEWTHYQHDPQGTMVGKDQVVGPPRRIQWEGDPKWLRNHDFMSSMHAMVSAGGRIFYIMDEGSRAHVFLPARWTLIARDAFNGTILWKLPLKDWWPSNWPLKSGPGYLPRRLVAVGDRVYVTLGLLEPVSVLDAATGKVLGTCDETKTTEEIICDNGVLFLLVDPNRKPVGYRAKTANYTEIKAANSGWGWTPESPARSIVAVEAQSRRPLWQHTARIAPLTLTVAGQRVFYFNGERLVALDRTTGKQVWLSDTPARLKILAATGEAPRLIYSDGVLVLCHEKRVLGFDATTGKQLWEGDIPPTGHHSPSDLFIVHGLIWSAHTGHAQENGTPLMALDLHSGKTVKDFTAKNIAGFPMHPRCYPGRATEQYLLLPGMGAEFYKIGGTTVEVNDYIRGSCIYGVMPCNGLLYKPPDTCACFYMSKLEYLCALAPAAKSALAPAPDEIRLERGPAFPEIRKPESKIQNPNDWPMYRHDIARSDASHAAISAALKKSWDVKLSGTLTQPVCAAGRVFVAAASTHTLYALEAQSGRVLWRHTAGGAIDSSPVVDAERVWFGCADGRVYCLRAGDGALNWRYLVAPEDRQIISRQQPESVWPLSGSVLVRSNTVYALAGRNMFFDGGLRLTRLDATTGQRLSETVLNENDPQTGKNLQTLIAVKSMPVANADVLSCDDRFIYMATRRFDLNGNRAGPEPVSAHNKEFSGANNHLFCPTGFLDNLWFHRSYYIYGQSCGEGWAEYSQAQREVPCGRMLVVDGSRAYGFRADNLGNTLLPTPLYRLYAADTKLRTAEPVAHAGKKAGKGKKKVVQEDGTGIAGAFKVYWQIPSPPLLVNAMALAGDKLLVAGPPDMADESKMLGFLPGVNDEINRQLQAQDDAWRGKLGSRLWVVGAGDGQRQAEYQFDGVPVFDGMIVADGRVFIATQDGRLVCWDKK